MPVWMGAILLLAAVHAGLGLVSSSWMMLTAGNSSGAFGWVISRSATSSVPASLWLHPLQISAYSAAGVLLLACRRDRRALYLGGAFFVVASSYAYVPLSDLAAFHKGLIPSLAGTLTDLNANAFLPALAWLFVRDFPRIPAASSSDRIARLAIRISACAGIGLFGINMLLPGLSGHPEMRRVLEVFDNGRERSLYWPLLYALIVPALFYAFYRSRHAAVTEKRRVRVFLAALMLGAVPTALYVLLVSLFIKDWRAFRDTLPNKVVLAVIQACILSIPFATAYSVVVNQVLDIRLIVRKVIQYGLARYTIIAGTALPFVVAAIYLYANRQESIAGLFRGGSPVLLAAVLLAGFIGLAVRERAMESVDRRFFREQYDAHRILAELTDQVRRADSQGALGAFVADGIDRALHVESISLLSAERRPGVFSSPDHRVRSLKGASVLATLLSTSPEPFDVDLEKPGSAVARFPEDERQWLADGGYRLIVPLITASGPLIGFIALGEKKSELPFSNEDRRLLCSVAASTAMALENLRARAELSPVGAPDSAGPGLQGVRQGTAAGECPRCHSLHPLEVAVCPACSQPLLSTAVPYVLGGKFRFQKKVGSGGMGVVYQAFDIALARTVAIKVLPRISPESAMRFRREARAMAAVSHPNLEMIFGAENWRGTPMLILEFLEGGTLAERIRCAPFTEHEAVDVGVTIAGVLDCIHRAGILHRDVKPGNIGYTADGTVKLLDFGLAHIVSSTRPAEEGSTVSRMEIEAPFDPSSMRGALTDTGVLVGTIAYLSPEAVMGGQPGIHFDLWALALVLYEALAGRNPVARNAAAETVRCIREHDIPDIREFLPGTTPALSDFFKAALSAEVKDRPATAREFQARLRAIRA